MAKKLTKEKSWALRLLAVASALVLTLTACTGAKSTEEQASESASTVQSAEDASTFFTTDRVHTIDVELDSAGYEEMLQAYATSGDKEWLSVTVTIDGTTYKDVGLRLKGNKSLRTALASERGITLSAEDLSSEESASDSEGANTKDPATIPWLIRLDKYIDGQQHLGRTDYVVRGNDTESYLNEAVAVAMLEEAGLPTHRVGFTSFSVNGEEPVLRLVSEVPDDELWNQEWFGDEGSTWKADSDGDWDYHGEDGSEYEDIWKQRTGEDDMTPIVEFMDFINNSSDTEFSEELPKKLDVEEFATYLAAEKLVGNTDTISGPGNNGYLHYEPSTGQMIVVPWDHDMVFGGMGMGGPGGGGFGGRDEDQDGTRGPGGGRGGRPSEDGDMPDGMEPPDGMGAPGGMGDFQPPEGMEPPEGTELPEGMELPDGMEFPEGMEPPDMEGFDPGQMGAPGGGGFGGSNVLEERFLANSEFSELYQERYQALREKLVDSGFALKTLNRYADLLVDQASDLISAKTVESDRSAIESYLNSEAS